MLFPHPLDKKFTKTPNVFFEEVLCAKGTTFNEAKLMGYLIRNTLGYNHKATWIHVSRRKLSEHAQISYGSINPTIQSCISKGWILEVKQGDMGREERYLFLRTPRNEQIVECLKKGDIPLAHLGNLIYMDSENVCIPFGIKAHGSKANSTPVTRSKKEDGYPCSNSEHIPTTNNEQGDSKSEPVTYSLDAQGCSNVEPDPSTVTEQDPHSNPEHVNNPSDHIDQGIDASLKTITKKDKSIKDKDINHNTQQQKQDVVVVQKQIMDLFNKRISKKNVEALILLSDQESIDLDDTIQNTYEYHTKVEACRNVFGAIKYALENGAWEISDTIGDYGSRVNPLLMQEQKQAPRRKYEFLPVERVKAIYGLA